MIQFWLTKRRTWQLFFRMFKYLPEIALHPCISEIIYSKRQSVLDWLMPETFLLVYIFLYINIYSTVWHTNGGRWYRGKDRSIHQLKQSLLAKTEVVKTSKSLVCFCTVDQKSMEEKQDFHYLYAKGCWAVKDLQRWGGGREKSTDCSGLQRLWAEK